MTVHTVTLGMTGIIYSIPCSLEKPRGRSIVVTNHTADVRIMSDRPATLGLVPVELSTSIYGSHTAT